MALTYYIPDWDDRVDPDYDFQNDTHTPDRNPYRDDRYAHEIYDPPPYDGVLISRAVIDDDRKKHDRMIAAGSVHAYLRLPADGDHFVLGDCGAFTYWQKENPPYTTADMLEYYQNLGFNYGVSIDHLIFTDDPEERQRRWVITIDNARDFLQHHRSGNYLFTPIGVAQGWDPTSYRRAAQELIQMGYSYIAVGGLVRSKTQDIIAILAAVQEVLRPDTQVHLFGVNRPEAMGTFARLGVTSFDSASRLRRAWMDDRQNYFLNDRAYRAIRIREARLLATKHQLDLDHTRQLEQAALNALRAYDNNTCSLDQVLDAVIAYAALFGDVTEAMSEGYRITLSERPWKSCECAICQAIGIEVIIFRGNNRNRRRGFHNTWQLYQQILKERAQPNSAAEIAFQDYLL
ncbi:MAG: hypothetical protein OHK0022_19190 [Roseiflexaceae bacterium]